MFEREQRYVVVKISDFHAAGITDAEIQAFNAVCDKVSRSRIQRSKGLLECVVVEKDWPEYEPTWAAIAKRCTPPQPEAAACPHCFGGTGCDLCNGYASRYMGPYRQT